MFGDKVLKAFEGEVELKSVLAKAEYVGVYMSAHWCGPCRSFTPKLKEAYEGWEKKKPGSFPVIFVSCDRDNGSFEGYFAEMPWHAVRFSDKERVGFGSNAGVKLDCSGIPMFAVFDAKGNLVTGNGAGVVRAGGDVFEGLRLQAKLASASGPELFPLLLGDAVLKADGKEEEPTAELVAKAKVVGVYFSAHWCGPCRRFTPMLVEAYEKARKDFPGKFEVIFVSCDRDQAAFDNYFKSMPWNAVKFSDKARTGFGGYAGSKFGCQGIPDLVLLDNKGAILERQGTGIVSTPGKLDAMLK